MKSFSIRTNVYFGENSLDRVSEIKNKKVMIICDEFIANSELLSKVTDRLVDCEYSIYSKVVPDPSIDIVAEGVSKLNEFGASIIIALGGGSSIDAAKAIREFSKEEYGSKVNIEECIAIPTTSGTGSEVTQFSVITDKEKGIKYPMVNKSLLPVDAILDPELVVSVPPRITADTGMDVLTHAIEAYVSTDANDFSDALAEKAITLVFRFLPLAYKEGSNLLAREKMHNASCLAGMAFNNAGLGICHSLSHAIGAKTHLSHGRCIGINLPYIIEFNSDLGNVRNEEYSTQTLKYERIAKIIGLPSNNTRVAVNALIRKIKTFEKELGFESSFEEYKDIIIKDKAEIIDAAFNDVCTKTNPKEVSKEDLEKLLETVL